SLVAIDARMESLGAKDSLESAALRGYRQNHARRTATTWPCWMEDRNAGKFPRAVAPALVGARGLGTLAGGMWRGLDIEQQAGCRWRDAHIWRPHSKPVEPGQVGRRQPLEPAGLRDAALDEPRRDLQA